MNKEHFAQLVEEAVAKIPRNFRKYLDNIAVIVEDEPSANLKRNLGNSPFSTILGYYHGIPFKHRGPYYGNHPPDVIIIFQKSIETICRTDEEIKEKVKEVVIHEIGHYFGLSEEKLREIEKS